MGFAQSVSHGPRPAQHVAKPWGEQFIFAVTASYIGAVNHIRQGQSLSLQFHRTRDETLYLYDGLLHVEFESDDGEMHTVQMRPGQSIRFCPLRKHRISALEDSVLFEVSTPPLDDVVRLQDLYGRTLDGSSTSDR
jgi:mannose-6-phosphate isomerase